MANENQMPELENQTVAAHANIEGLSQKLNRNIEIRQLAIQTMYQNLVDLSKKLDRNFAFQIIVSFFGLFYVVTPDHGRKIFDDLNIIPIDLIPIAIPVFMVKVFIDFAFYSLQYVRVKDNLEVHLNKLFTDKDFNNLKGEITEVLVPPCILKYIYWTEKEKDPNYWSYWGTTFFYMAFLSVLVSMVLWHYVFYLFPTEDIAKDWRIVTLPLVIFMYWIFSYNFWEKIKVPRLKNVVIFYFILSMIGGVVGIFFIAPF